jgi:hypothetical protein
LPSHGTTHQKFQANKKKPKQKSTPTLSNPIKETKFRSKEKKLHPNKKKPFQADCKCTNEPSNSFLQTPLTPFSFFLPPFSFFLNPSFKPHLNRFLPAASTLALTSFTFPLLFAFSLLPLFTVSLEKKRKITSN